LIMSTYTRLARIRNGFLNFINGRSCPNSNSAGVTGKTEVGDECKLTL
jgi:hypothetical protein